MGDTVLKRLQLGSEGGFTSGVGSVYNGGLAVAATRRVAVEEPSEFGYAELIYDATEEARGTYASTYNHALQYRAVKGKFGGLIYPDDLIFFLRGAVSGTPTVATLPTAPAALLAATNVLASNTLTTQPNATADGALAKILAVTLSNAAPNNSAVTFTFTGTDVNSNPLTEQVAFPAGTTSLSAVGGGGGATTVTKYTTNYFKTVSGITSSAQPAGDQIAVGAVNAFLWTFLPDMATSTLLSQTGEYFDGSTAWQMPGLVIPKLELDLQIGKSARFKGDAMARDMVSNALTAILDQNLPAIPTLYARYYSDPVGSAPGTTQVAARLIQAQLSIENGIMLGKAADGTPLASFVARKKYKTKGEMTLLFNNGVAGSEDPSDFAAFNASYASRTVRVALPGIAYLPAGVLSAAGNWPTQLLDANGKGGLYGLMVDHVGKWTAAAPVNHDGRLAVKLTHEMEVDLANVGAAYQVTVVNRMNPNM